MYFVFYYSVQIPCQMQPACQIGISSQNRYKGTTKNAHTQEKLVFSPFHPIIPHSFAPC
jgi:hypothetical protein